MNIKDIYMYSQFYHHIFCFSEEGDIDVVELGSKSCVTRFIKKMLSIVSIDHFLT